jgi:hypothetical protein
MFWAILFTIFFAFKSIVFADDITPTPTPTPAAVLSWGSGDSNARRGDQFNINLVLSGAASGTNYHFKVYGGVTGVNDAIDVLNNDSWSNGYSGSWSSMPSITGNGTITMRLRVNSGASSGTYHLYGVVEELNLTTSSSYSITINDPLPVSTPTNTPTITPTPTTTPTPKPTSTPTPYESPTPMLPTPEPLATDIPTLAVTITPMVAVSSTTPAPESSGFSNYLPFIFITLGLLLLGVPLFGPKIIAKIKSLKKNPPTGEPPVTLIP